MRQNVLQIGPYAAGNASLIAAVQQAVAGQPLVLAGGSPFVNDVPRTVLLTFALGVLSAAIAEDGGAFVDETGEANSAAANDMTLFPAVPAAGIDRYNFGSDAKFSSIDVNVGTAGVGTYTVVWEYFNGTSFVALAGVSDGTTNFKTGGVNTVSFTVPGDWVASTINGQGPFFYIRAEFQAGTSTTVPIGTQAFVAGTAAGNRFLITGTGRKGNQIQESVLGAAATVATEQPFASILSIIPENNIGGDISAGTVTVVPTAWFPVDYIRNPVDIGLTIKINGATVSLDVELTRSNLLGRRGNDPQPTVGQHVGSVFDLVYPVVNSFDHGALVAVVADANDTVKETITALRLVSNAAITGGTPTMEIAQAGHRGA